MAYVVFDTENKLADVNGVKIEGERSASQLYVRTVEEVHQRIEGGFMACIR